MKVIPLHSEDLIKALDREFPLALPDPKDPPEVLWLKVGKRELIEMLLTRLEHTQTKARAPR